MPNGIERTFEELLQVPPLTQLLPNTMVASQRYGLLRSISRGRGMEFSEVRAYLPGDDIRNIDWRITARTGRPYTKLFREERDRNVYIILDLDPAMYFGSQGQLKARFASLIAASCAWQAFDMKDKVDGMKLLVNRARPGSVFHIISDFYRLDDSSWLYLRRLNKSHTVRTYQVYDKIEMSIDGKGTVGIDTGYNQGFISSLNNDFVENYRRIGIHRIHNIDKMLTEASQRNVCIDVSETILTDTSSESKD